MHDIASVYSFTFRADNNLQVIVVNVPLQWCIMTGKTDNRQCVTVSCPGVHETQSLAYIEVSWIAALKNSAYSQCEY
jgi:hypothetical protein